MYVYPSSIDLPSRTLRFLTGQLTARRQEIGTRWRRLPAARRALFALAHLRCGDTHTQLAAGFGIGIATAYRYIREAVETLSALAPPLAEAMRTIRTKAFVSQGPVVTDGGVKPEITAPGSAITAARAAGTLDGAANSEFYATISGTSMATPHASGAAAIHGPRPARRRCGRPAGAARTGARPARAAPAASPLRSGEPDGGPLTGAVCNARARATGGAVRPAPGHLPRRMRAASRAAAIWRASAALRDSRPGLVPRPRNGAPPRGGVLAAGAPATGTPDGALAPVIRLSAVSPERTWVIVGRMPASDMSRVTSRRW
ncbi:transposase family protein [Actinacidiphila glaucinigra]|uniref:transposase family protein n=1 Tax=Actinacidiphila glaucinigra TaxID=235986 RepID=UPI0036F0E667